MTDTPRLALPLIDGAQAQKHVTHNEALLLLDALVQLAVLDRDLTAPPGAPGEGERWLVAVGATGAWAGHDHAIAAWQAGGWVFSAPQPGWLAYVLDEGALVAWTGSAWVDAVAAPGALHNLTRLGLGTTADATNPFAAKLNKALWTAKYDGEGGDGDLRYTLNKEAPAKVLSLLMQSGWSGRAEIGLIGSDDLAVKVSADGSAWKEALVLDRATGAARFPHGVAHAASGHPLRSLLFTPGGDGTVSIWRITAAHAQNPRSATIASVSGDTITLTAAVVAATFGQWTGYMAGVARARIWNTSKSPAESAWITGSPNASAITVHNAADIAGWSPGDTIQIGDPTGVTPNRVVALDIAPMLQNLFGAVFRQSGIVVKASFTSATATDGIDMSPSGVAGSFVGAAGAVGASGVTIIPCTELSPISDSNLVFVRETIGSTAMVSLISSVAVYV